MEGKDRHWGLACNLYIQAWLMHAQQGGGVSHLRLVSDIEWMKTFDILAGVRGFSNDGCARGVPMVFHYSCSFHDSLALRGHKGGQD